VHPILAGRHQQTIMQQNRINRCTATEICWNKNEDARTSWVAQLAQELNSIPVDRPMGLHRNRDKFTNLTYYYLITSTSWQQTQWLGRQSSADGLSPSLIPIYG